MGWEVGQDGLHRVPSSSEILRLAKETPYAMNKMPLFQDLNYSKSEKYFADLPCLLTPYIYLVLDIATTSDLFFLIDL